MVYGRIARGSDYVIVLWRDGGFSLRGCFSTVHRAGRLPVISEEVATDADQR